MLSLLLLTEFFFFFCILHKCNILHLNFIIIYLSCLLTDINKPSDSDADRPMAEPSKSKKVKRSTE